MSSFDTNGISKNIRDDCGISDKDSYALPVQGHYSLTLPGTPAIGSGEVCMPSADVAMVATRSTY